MAGLSCSFSCGESLCKMEGIGDQIVPLMACKNDMTSYLKLCKVGDSIEEWELILNRGQFIRGERFSTDLDTLIVCPAHRHSLSTGFRVRQSCVYPSHHNKRKTATRARNLRGVTRKMSLDIYDTQRCDVPIGGGICSVCRTDLYKRRKESDAETIPVVDYPALDESAPDPGEGTSQQAQSMVTSTPWEKGPPAVFIEAGSAVASEQDFLIPQSTVPIGRRKRTRVYFSETGSDTGSEVELSNAPKQAKETSSDSSSTGDEEHSMWVDRSMIQKEKRHNLNNLLQQNDYQPLKSTLNTQWEDISVRQQNYYLQKVSESFLSVLSDIVPGQESKVWDVMKSRSLTSSRAKKPKTVDISQVQSLISAYQEASKIAQRQILSLFANDFTKQELMESIPGITRYQIDAARQHSVKYGSGETLPQVSIRRNRLSADKTDHFLDFICQPRFLQDVAYGTKTLKLDSGEKVIIPAVVRTVIPTRIVQQYKLFCTSENFPPLSDSSLFRILDVCAASQQTSLQGLDYISTEGSDAMDSLITILHQIGDPENLSQSLRVCKRYLKSEYESHIQTTDLCADHCASFALSERSSEYLSTCDHEHSKLCVSCELLRKTLIDVKQHILTKSQTIQTHCHDYDLAESAIQDWKAHLLRGYWQDLAKQMFLKEMQEDEVLIVMDWAMKFLPMFHREKESDFFGKRGKSWHITCVISRVGQEHMVECFVHIFEEVTQNWLAVASIVEDVLSSIKHSNPNIKSCRLRSDNAGCYHNSSLLMELQNIGQRTGVAVSRYDFSETQQGKDVCDRKIAPLKRHIRLYVDEGKNCVSGHDMKAAMESNGGVKGCTVKVCGIQQNDVSHPTITGIMSLNNFAFEKSGNIRAWKAFGIGEGKSLTFRKSKITLPKLTVIEGPSSSSPQLRPFSTNRSSTKVLVCPENTCTETFFSEVELQEHISMGWHESVADEPSGTIFDRIRKEWAARVTSIASKGIYFQPGTSTEGLSSLEMGWSLKKAKRSERMKPDVRAFLKDQFLKGANSGKKTDGMTCCHEMRTAKNPDGAIRFSVEDWRTPKQINSYFSRLAAEQKKHGLIPDEDEDDSAHAQEIEVENMRKAVREKVVKKRK